MMKYWNALTRIKQTNENEPESKLARVLTLLDLTALGVGSTLGLGVYVLAGSVAYEQAGPAVTLSFLVAAIASAFAGFCYAEFAARVPKAGSAYVYSYVTVGEFVAFTIGWNLILEYVIGTSSVARGLSGYLDSLLDNGMSKTLREIMPINVNFLAEYPDFLSFFMVLLLTSLLAFGVKESSMLNNIFTAVNLITVVIVLVAGAIKADPANWTIPKESIPANVKGGEGGFMPYGFAGVMAGAAKCFYGFVGFDCVATTGEEAKNPKRNIPLSIVLSLIIIFLAYFGVSTVLTMMWPYYDQDPNAPFPHVFQEVGWIEIKWIVTIGALFALCTSLLGAMFPLPRVLYAMANDGIIFKFLSSVHNYTKTPLIATIVSGILAAFMSLIFNLHQLIDMMSIGTLLAYTIVAISVLVLRYKEEEGNGGAEELYEIQPKLPVILKQVFNLNFNKHPNTLSSNITKAAIIVFSILSTLLCIILKISDVSLDHPISIILLIVISIALILTILVIYRQPTANVEISFKVPMVPLVPCLSVLINLYLMFQLDIYTWVRFLVWIAIGYVIYFGYGIRNSVQGEFDSTLNLTKFDSNKISNSNHHHQQKNITEKNHSFGVNVKR